MPAPGLDASMAFDIGNRIKLLARRGAILGALFGLVFGTILVAIPLGFDILTFGFLGTLLICVVECAAVAGGFTALAALLYGLGLRRCSAAEFENTLQAK